MHNKVRHDIICPFPDFNGTAGEVGMDKYFHPMAPFTNMV